VALIEVEAAILARAPDFPGTNIHLKISSRQGRQGIFGVWRPSSRHKDRSTNDRFTYLFIVFVFALFAALRESFLTVGLLHHPFEQDWASNRQADRLDIAPRRPPSPSMFGCFISIADDCPMFLACQKLPVGLRLAVTDELGRSVQGRKGLLRQPCLS